MPATIACVRTIRIAQALVNAICNEYHVDETSFRIDTSGYGRGNERCIIYSGPLDSLELMAFCSGFRAAKGWT